MHVKQLMEMISTCFKLCVSYICTTGKLWPQDWFPDISYSGSNTSLASDAIIVGVTCVLQAGTSFLGTNSLK